jgi:NADH dehydrogenase
VGAEILILGGGFAGVSAARELERKAPNEVGVTLVSRENYLLFTPMLPEVACGTIEARHIVQPLRAGLRRARFILGDVLEINVSERTVSVLHPLLGSRSTLRFDHLVLALGSQTSTFGLPGVAHHTIPLKTLFDAAQLRSRVTGAFEAAAGTNDRDERDRRLRFIIIGGGFTGVEIAGEMTGFIQHIRRYYPTLSGCTPEIIVVEGGKRLLAELPARFGKRAAVSLQKRNVSLELGERVASADEGGLSLKNGKRYESATLIWVAGVEPAPVMKKLGLATSKEGALLVNGDFSVPGLPGVWGIGDCVQIPKPAGGTYASLAQNAVREGPFLAKNIVATLHGKSTKLFAYRLQGMMASLGDRDALAELPGRQMIAGFPAWLLWRAYYLSRLPGLSRKMGVAMDWIMSGVFQQSVARLAFVTGGSAKECRAPE